MFRRVAGEELLTWAVGDFLNGCRFKVKVVVGALE